MLLSDVLILVEMITQGGRVSSHYNSSEVIQDAEPEPHEELCVHDEKNTG